MKAITSAALFAAIAVCAPAHATTPTISGNYIATITKFCQMANTYHFSSGSPENIGNYLDGITTSGSNFKQSLYAVSFSPAKGKATTSGFDNGGDIEIFQLTGSISNTLGSQITQAPNSGKVSYSNTDTTITLGDQTYNALYGQVNKNGVAGYVAFQGVFASDQGNMCTEQGVLQAQ